MGDKGETSVNSCGPRNHEWKQVWETSVGDKGETSVNPCRPRNTEWETSVGDKCGRQVGDKWGTCGRQGHPEWETSGGDKCKFMRPKEPRVGDQGETSVNSCGPRHPEWKTRGRQV